MNDKVTFEARPTGPSPISPWQIHTLVDGVVKHVLPTGFGTATQAYIYVNRYKAALKEEALK